MHWRTHAHEHAYDPNGASGSSMSIPRRPTSLSSQETTTTWSEEPYQRSGTGHAHDEEVQDISRPVSYVDSEAPSYQKELVYDTSAFDKAEKASNHFDSDGTDSEDPDFNDPNLDYGQDMELEEDSPYPEVRSAVSNIDVMDMPVGTLRAWILGFFFAVIISGLNQFFFFRYPSVTITGLVPQLLSFPLGRLWARFMPNVSILGIDINPGPFTIKEHVLVTVMAGVGAVSAYGTDIIAVQRVYYGQRYSFLYQWLLVMSTQLLGFALGGIGRRFLVSPPSMIWPANLVYCALFNTLHSQHYYGIGSRMGLSRERFFLYAFLACFAWTWLPGYLFTALSTFSWVCWIFPRNKTVNQLFGYSSGLGMSILTFDWGMISYIGSPLATPWWAEANIVVGFMFFFWLLTPVLYYSNAWYTKYLPISSRTPFDNTGQEYNISRVLGSNGQFDEQAYQDYSPIFLSATFTLSYGLSFAGITATLVHTALYFSRQIWTQSRKSLSEQADIHARLMSRYVQVPDWWYLVVFGVMSVFALVLIEVWHTEFPVWGFILALLISFVHFIPIGMIQAITNQQIGLNVLTELISGYAIPGRPLAMMLFKTYGYNLSAQAIQFSSSLKLGHYMKIPPRTLFIAQVLATALAGTVQLGVQAWMFENIPDICTANQKDSFTCPSAQVFGTASFIWGVIGPRNLFSEGKLYSAITYFFLAGAVAPFIPWCLTKRWPNSVFRYINLPVIFAGTGPIPPATAENYIPWTIVGFIFQYWIRRRAFSWWTKYNYVLSAALDSGYAIAIVVIFFALQLPKGNSIGASSILSWWGNTVFKNTDDYLSLPGIMISPTGTYGPEEW